MQQGQHVSHWHNYSVALMYHAGRWRDTLVAIKMVEHAAGANAPEQADKIQREALLSTSLSHPNVITTFKVSTMLVSAAQVLRSSSSAETDWSAPNMPRTPRSPQQPGGASEAADSSHRSFLDSANSLHDDGSAQATPRDSAMSEHGSRGMRVPLSPFSQAPAGGPADLLHDSSSRTGPDGGGDAAATAVHPTLDSAARNAGRRPADVSRIEEGDYALSPEEMAAEDDPDAVEERCAQSADCRSACLWRTSICRPVLPVGQAMQIPWKPCLHAALHLGTATCRNRSYGEELAME